jgi:hypothetical protein
MPIHHHEGGATTLTGDSIQFFRLCALKGAVHLELKGIKIRRGPVIWRAVKQEFNLAGNREAVYQWLCAEVDRLRPLQQHTGDAE